MIKLLNSPRFLGILAIGLLEAIALFGYLTDVQLQGLVHIIEGIIASAIVVRTVDRVGDKL